MEVKKVEIDLRIKPSPDVAKKILVSVLDCLLHSRQQIPFQFSTFKKLVDCQIKDNKIKKDWRIQGQLRMALETIEKINSLRNVSRKIFMNKNSISSSLKIFQLISTKYISGLPLMILFGSTIQTAKESYQIHFPNINEISLPAHINEATLVSTTMLELVQIDGFLNVEDGLPVTNVFILFKRRKGDLKEQHEDLIELKNFKLSKSCRQFKINFRDPSDFEIFDDEFKEMSLTENYSKKTDQTCDDIWYQSKAYVKGFKDSLVNNKTIWN